MELVEKVVGSSSPLFKCKDCLYTSNKVSNVEKHAEGHLSPDYYKCQFCPSTYGKEVYFKSHMKAKHSLHQFNLPFKCRLCHIRFGWNFERDSHELICTDVESPASTVLSPNSEKVSSSIAEIVLSPPALKVPSPNTEKVPSSSAEMVFSPTDETVFSATDETVFSPTDETVLMDEVTTTLHFHNSTTVQNTPTKTTPYSKKSAYICGTCSKSYIRKDHHLTHVINCTRNKLRNIKPGRQHQRKLTVSSPRVSAEVAHAYAFKESMKDGENDDASNIVNVEISSAVALDTAFKESSKEGENNNATKNVEISAAIALDTGFKESMKDSENNYAISIDNLEINRKSLGGKEENNDTTIIVSDHEDITPRKFQDPSLAFCTPMSSVSTNENTTILKKRRMESLVTTINVSDSDDEETLTSKKPQKGNKKIVKKRLFPCYPLRQNQIPNGEWKNEDNPRSTKLSTSEVSLIKSSHVGDSTKRYEEAVNKIKLLGSDITLTRLVELD